MVQWTQAAGLSRSPVVRYWLICGLLMNVFRQNKRWVIPFVVRRVGGVCDVMCGIGREGVYC